MKKQILLILLGLGLVGSQALALGPTQKKNLRTGLEGIKTLIDKVLEKLDDPAKSTAMTPQLVLCGLFDQFLFGPNNLFLVAKGLFNTATQDGRDKAALIDLGIAALAIFKNRITGALSCPTAPDAASQALEDF